MSGTRWLARCIVWVKWGFALILLLGAIRIVSSLALVGVQKWIIDDIFWNKNYELLVPVMSIFAVSIVSFNLFHLLSGRAVDSTNFKLQRLLSGKLLETMHRMPTGRIQQERTANFIHFFSNDIGSISNTVTGYMSNGVQNLLSLLILGIVIGISSPILLVVLLLLSSVYIALGKRFASRLRTASREVQDTKSDLLVHIEEGISATREVVAFNRQKWESERYGSLFSVYFDRVMKQGKLQNVQKLLGDPLRWGASLFILGYGGYQVIRGDVSLGMFVIIYQFASQFMESVNGVYDFVMGYAGRLSAVDRLRGVLEGEQRQDGHLKMTEPLQSLRFRDVRFRYSDDTPFILDGLSLEIPIGRKVAFVGTSGGGKSTIAQLLVRFFEPQEGTIRANDHPLEQWQRLSWTDRVAIVFQEPYLFPDTVRSNITLGREHFSMQDVEAACEKAQIHEFIASLPDGYDTQVGERGIMLSGGQRQRLALARAILADPEVLVLDEATSALDLETERLVQRSMDETRQGKTTIVIAHRLSTIMNADHIFVMDHGRVVEQGTHLDLMQHGSVYRKLVESQHKNEVVAVAIS